MPRIPGWVAVFVVVLTLVVLLAVAAMLLGAGDHGPGRHLSAPGGPGAVAAPPASGHVDGVAP